MLLKTSMMLGELLSVKLGNRLLRADRPRVGHEAWHADPLGELTTETHFKPAGKRMSRFCNDQVRRLATKPPKQPTAIPPASSRKQSPAERKLTDEKLTASARGTR